MQEFGFLFALTRQVRPNHDDSVLEADRHGVSIRSDATRASEQNNVPYVRINKVSIRSYATGASERAATAATGSAQKFLSL